MTCWSKSGPTLAGSLVSAGVVDELVIYQAPHIMGSQTRGMFLTPGWQNLDQRLALDIVDIRKVGSDIQDHGKTSELTYVYRNNQS